MFNKVSRVRSGVCSKVAVDSQLELIIWELEESWTLISHKASTLHPMAFLAASFTSLFRKL